MVVARLIDWFIDGENGPFCTVDYQAIMMDTGLMNDEYELLPMAKELTEQGK